MIKKKTYITIIIIIILFSSILFVLYGIDNLKSEKETTTLIVGNNSIWKYQKKEWKEIRGNSNIDKLNWQKYHVFSNNEELGNFYLWHDDKWYVFDEEKKAINLDGDLLAFKSNNEITVYQTTISDTKENIVDNILSQNNIEEKEFTANYKVSIDFDGDGSEEDFYILSNTFSMDFNPKQIFSLVYMVKNNELYKVYQDVSNNNYYNGCKPYITSFLDINNDKQLELILSCAEYSVSNPVNTLYEFKNNEFKILISNQ